MNKLIRFLAAATLAAGLGTAAAVDFVYSGDTTGGPTFDRPLETLDFLPVPGHDSNYHALLFSVDTDGDYAFLSIATGWDNFTLLYAPLFDPAAPLLNALIANDDLGAIGTSGFSYTLSSGVVYTFVTAGFEGGFDFGPFTNTISGPGMVTVVPEPGSGVLLLLGAGALAAWRSRAAGPAGGRGGS